jgi:hypothetical protein
MRDQPSAIFINTLIAYIRVISPGDVAKWLPVKNTGARVCKTLSEAAAA